MAVILHKGSFEKYRAQKSVDNDSTFLMLIVKPYFKNLYVALRMSIGNYSETNERRVKLSCSLDFHLTSGTNGV